MKLGSKDGVPEAIEPRLERREVGLVEQLHRERLGVDEEVVDGRELAKHRAVHLKGYGSQLGHYADCSPALAFRRE